MSKEEASKRLKEFLAGTPPAVTEDQPESQEEEVQEELQSPEDVRAQVQAAIDVEWVKKVPAKVKTTVKRCIVIDKDDHWHQEAMVDLKGVDTTAFTWGYYGVQLPVLVEDFEGNLHPWYFRDQAGENSNRLYKAANPEGYKATFRHRNTLLQKIQVGLMVVLVLGLFFLMFVLINN
jgi:hypothetical protein